MSKNINVQENKQLDAAVAPVKKKERGAWLGRAAKYLTAAVVLLVLPYLLLGNAQYITALVCMLLIVVMIIAGFTYYTSVAMDQPFKSRFLEMAIISISVAVVSFVVGILAKRVLGVDI